MNTCPNCGAQIADNYRFCTECGNKIPSSNVCPHCGAAMNDGDVFCQKCGMRADEAVTPPVAEPVLNSCPHCGAPMGEADAFCQNCGKRRFDGGQANVATSSTEHAAPPSPQRPKQPSGQRQTTYTSQQTPKSSSKNGAAIPIVILSVILLLALAGGGGWWYYHSNKTKTTPEVMTQTADNKSESSSSLTFDSEESVVAHLANQTFQSSDGLTIRFDGNGKMFSGGAYAGVISVVSHEPESAVLNYKGGVYSEGKIIVKIVGDKLKLIDPADGTEFRQR